MTSLCVVADTHQKHRQLELPVADVLVHCGDICSFRQEDMTTLKDVDSWFGEYPCEAVICIGGNHDYELEDGGFEFTNAVLLQDQLIEVAGLAIYGSPWCPDLPGFAFSAGESELLGKWKQIPAGIDVLITHTPPHGVLDLPTSQQRHLGCHYLRRELERICPRYHLFGHVHASYGASCEDSVHYVNASIVGGKDYQVRNPATILRIS